MAAATDINFAVYRSHNCGVVAHQGVVYFVVRGTWYPASCRNGILRV